MFYKQSIPNLFETEEFIFLRKFTQFELLQNFSLGRNKHNKQSICANKVSVSQIQSLSFQNLVNTNIWERSFCQMHSLNFGIGGDRTEHVLWRLQNGELEQVAPKVGQVQSGNP